MNKNEERETSFFTFHNKNEKKTRMQIQKLTNDSYCLTFR